MLPSTSNSNDTIIAWINSDLHKHKSLDILCKNDNITLFNCWLYMDNGDYYITDCDYRLEAQLTEPLKFKLSNDNCIKICIKSYLYTTLICLRESRQMPYILVVIDEYVIRSKSSEPINNKFDKKQLKDGKHRRLEQIESEFNISRKSLRSNNRNSSIAITKSNVNKIETKPNNNSPKRSVLKEKKPNLKPDVSELSCLMDEMSTLGSLKNYTLEIVNEVNNSNNSNNQNKNFTKNDIKNLNHAFFTQSETLNIDNVNKNIETAATTIMCSIPSSNATSTNNYDNNVICSTQVDKNDFYCFKKNMDDLMLTQQSSEKSTQKTKDSNNEQYEMTSLLLTQAKHQQHSDTSSSEKHIVNDSITSVNKNELNALSKVNQQNAHNEAPEISTQVDTYISKEHFQKELNAKLNPISPIKEQNDATISSSNEYIPSAQAIPLNNNNTVSSDDQHQNTNNSNNLLNSAIIDSNSSGQPSTNNSNKIPQTQVAQNNELLKESTLSNAIYTEDEDDESLEAILIDKSKIEETKMATQTKVSAEDNNNNPDLINGSDKRNNRLLSNNSSITSFSTTTNKLNQQIHNAFDDYNLKLKNNLINQKKRKKLLNNLNEFYHIKSNHHKHHSKSKRKKSKISEKNGDVATGQLISPSNSSKTSSRSSSLSLMSNTTSDDGATSYSSSSTMSSSSSSLLSDTKSKLSSKCPLSAISRLNSITNNRDHNDDDNDDDDSDNDDYVVEKCSQSIIFASKSEQKIKERSYSERKSRHQKKFLASSLFASRTNPVKRKNQNNNDNSSIINDTNYLPAQRLHRNTCSLNEVYLKSPIVDENSKLIDKILIEKEKSVNKNISSVVNDTVLINKTSGRRRLFDGNSYDSIEKAFNSKVSNEKTNLIAQTPLNIMATNDETTINGDNSTITINHHTVNNNENTSNRSNEEVSIPLAQKPQLVNNSNSSNSSNISKVGQIKSLVNVTENEQDYLLALKTSIANYKSSISSNELQDYLMQKHNN